MKLKLRAWHNEDKYMIESVRSLCTILQHHLEIPQHPSWSNVDTTPTPDRYIIMAFTGFHDREHVEIFEGDILLSGDGEYDPVIFKEGVYGIEKEGEIVSLKEMYEVHTYLGIEKPLVAGNIYKDAHLLQ